MLKTELTSRQKNRLARTLRIYDAGTMQRRLRIANRIVWVLLIAIWVLSVIMLTVDSKPFIVWLAGFLFGAIVTSKTIVDDRRLFWPIAELFFDWARVRKYVEGDAERNTPLN
jgi:hypothetical protein